MFPDTTQIQENRAATFHGIPPTSSLAFDHDCRWRREPADDWKLDGRGRGFGKDGQPAVVMTLQKHLVADDHYTGLFVLRTDDLGKTWTGPTEIPELARRKAADGVTIVVIDVTPGWHAPTQKLIAIGAKILETATGDHASLYKLPRSYETSYATYDPKAKGSKRGRS